MKQSANVLSVFAALFFCSLFLGSCVARDGINCNAKESAEFGRTVIRSLGMDGRACYRSSSGQVYCLSRIAESPEAITVKDFSTDDRLLVLHGLFLCQEQAGELGNCEGVQADGWDCDHYGSGPKECFCTGLEACIALSTLPTCEGGGCGDCSQGDCCCTAP